MSALTVPPDLRNEAVVYRVLSRTGGSGAVAMVFRCFVRLARLAAPRYPCCGLAIEQREKARPCSRPLAAGYFCLFTPRPNDFAVGQSLKARCGALCRRGETRPTVDGSIALARRHRRSPQGEATDFATYIPGIYTGKPYTTG